MKFRIFKYRQHTFFAFEVATEEELNLSISLKEALEGAGWKYAGFKHRVMMSGVQIRIFNRDMFVPAATLMGALKDAGLAYVRMDPEDRMLENPNNPRLILIMIGSRPTFQYP